MLRFRYIRFLLIIVGAGVFTPSSAQQSVLRDGDWYKMSVSKNGVYKIDVNVLKKMGLDPGKIDPHKIKIYGNAGGMLPQANSTPRPPDLTELATYLNDTDDGVFGSNDYILFYAQGADQNHFDVKRKTFFYEKNLYDDNNYYFLTISSSEGKRMSPNDNAGTGLPIVQDFDDFVYHEVDLHNELQSGREWFGEDFYLNPDQTFTVDVSGIIDNSTIKVISNVMAQSYIGSSFKIYLNNVQLGEQVVGSIPNTQYGDKGAEQLDTLSANSNLVQAGGSLQLRYTYVKSAGYSRGYLDYFLVSVQRKLQLYGDQTIFRSSSSLKNTASQFQVASVPGDAMVWEITDIYNPKIQPFTTVNGAAVFSGNSAQLREFVVFSKPLAPTVIGKIANQNLHNVTPPNLLIVAHENFLSEAQRFADYREAQGNYTTLVVTPGQIYNEFSSGRQDITAIRDFVKYMHDKGDNLKSLLLFGRSSYDYKSRLSNNTNFVPTYESRNSLDPLATYSSDDYYSFLENTEGTWGESPPENHTLDISVGRFPVKTPDEARNIVDKIIEYETSTEAFGRWRKEITFVADDGDTNLHQWQSDQLAKKLESTHPEFNARRIFLDAYPQIITPSGQFAPDVNKAILDAINRGSLIINYTGHGGEQIWAQEKIFDNVAIEQLDNKTYPLFLTATCEFGRNDDPSDISGAELSVIQKSGGAIGMVTTTRPVNSSTNFELNEAFYDAMFTKDVKGYLSLGEIFRRTKNNSTSGVSNRNFSLLGDPSLHLAIPTYKVAVTDVKNQDGVDSVKALSTIAVRGEVLSPDSIKATGFSGTLDATLFDKQATFATLGDENPVYTYQQWSNAIFRGSATVTNGEFEFKFVVPKNIAYQVGQGKLSVYVKNKKSTLDGIGANLDFVVGKSYLNPAADNIPPVIRVFMGDTTFVNGGTVDADTYLVAKFEDQSGINISGYGIGNSIIGTLDNGESFLLNDYYDASLDDYTKGQLVYRMQNLKPGRHTLMVKAWDTYNNPGQASVDFVVSDGHSIQLESLGCYPNPARESATLFFTHTRAGDNLDAIVYFYDVTGQVLKTIDFQVTASNYKVELPEIDFENDFGKKLQSGLYFVRVVVRSLSNGSKSEQVTKLIILN